MFKCKKCGQDFEKYTSLRKHCGRLHKIHTSQTCVDYLLDGKYPVCKCGCGEQTKWHRKNIGNIKFNPYINGHNNRVINNWGHNKQAQIKSAETRRKQYENGERIIWCKGLTLKTDIRLKNLGKKISDKFNRKRKDQYSKRMSDNRKNGVVPTLYRNKHPQWKGGISTIQNVARSDMRLYEQWKYPILMRDNFSCSECKNSKNLHVHHNKETFSEIIKKVMTIEDYENIDNYDTKKHVTDRIIDYHVNNNVSGITLCKECHKKLHVNLNF